MSADRRKQSNRFFVPLLCVSWLLALPLSAAERPKLPADIEKLVNLAGSAPPEFAADALLRLVESGRVENPDWKRDLIEQAFQYAGRAQEPVRRVPIPGSQVDTRSGYRGASMRLGLDALSLECRAIRDMLALNPARARDLFSSLAKPRLDPLSCEDPLVYDVDDYYQTLQQIVSSTFSAAEREKDEHVHFLTTYLSGITAHAELAPAARAVATVNLTPAQLEVAEGALLTKLETVAHDDRSFSVAVGPLQQAVSALALAVAHQGLSSQGLVRGFRGYLVANLSGARCEDNVGPVTHSAATAKAVEWFNTQFHGDTAPIQRDEIQSSSVGGSAKIERYWQSGEAKQILTDAKRLRFSPQDRALSAAERNTPEWKRALSDFLSELESWKAGAETSEADYFHEKAIVYEALVELTPAGDEREKILTTYVAFLAGSDMQQQNPVEWFWHAKDTLERLRNTNGGNPEELLAAYKGSGNVVLTLYAALDSAAPDKPFYAK